MIILFEVKAIYPDGTTSLDELSFRILPPWYRSVPAYVFYFVLMLLGVWYIYRWDDVRVKRKKQQAVVEKDKELHEMEKEFEAEKVPARETDYAIGERKAGVRLAA